MKSIESICQDMGIKLVAPNQSSGPLRCKAKNVLRKMLEKHGEAHIVLVLRTIAESEGNSHMLVEQVLRAISDIILARPAWPETGSKWLEQFDNISLDAMMRIARANVKAVSIREGIATQIFAALMPVFDPPKEPSKFQANNARISALYGARPEIVRALDRKALLRLTEDTTPQPVRLDVEQRIERGEKISADRILRLCDLHRRSAA